MLSADKVSLLIVCAASSILIMSYFIKSRKKKQQKLVGYVNSLRCYPVKSCGPIFMNEMQIDFLGPRHDRQYVLLNDNEKFMTIRRYPKMCLLRPEIRSDCIRIHANSSTDYLDLPLQMVKSDGAYTKDIEVFNLTGEGVHVSEAADQWFTKHLEVACTLFCLPKDGKPRCSFEDEGAPGQPYSSTKDVLAFADGCPILITSEATLAFVNDHCDEKVTMERFRPNIVIDGCMANEEQLWTSICVGSTKLDRLFPCIRCVATTVDPIKGEKDKNVQPLKTIERVNPVSTEKWPTFSGPTFGCNYGVVKTGKIKVGDPVYIDI